MLTNECERDIQLELNRNYLKSFPARLKFCHIVSLLFYFSFIAVFFFLKNLIDSILCIFQFFGTLSAILLTFFTTEYHYQDYMSFTLMPIIISIFLTMCSLTFLVSSIINWKTNGKINMARINFVSL